MAEERECYEHNTTETDDQNAKMAASEVGSCKKDPATSGRAYVEQKMRDMMVTWERGLAKEASGKWWSKRFKWAHKALKDYGMFNHNQGSSYAKQRAFVENGSKLLEKLIATCNGKSTPIRNFSFQDLNRATNSFDPSSLVIHTYSSKWYEGSLEGRNVLIKKLTKESYFGSDYVINEIAISAMMSAHKNVLRLIGCCLETRVPFIVFEFAANGILAHRIHVFDRTERQYEPMVWSSRLRIAREIAHSISYLHSAFSRPIIHRDIKLRNIFLDQQDVAKLSCFGMSISIPQGETHVEDAVRGSFGYFCPAYVDTLKATEKVDVYSFGICLLELLTGEKPTETIRKDDKDEFVYLEDCMRKKGTQGCCINEINVDPTILQGEGGASISIDHQLQAVLDLAFICTEKEPKLRPTMVDVTKQLRRIEISVP